MYVHVDFQAHARSTHRRTHAHNFGKRKHSKRASVWAPLASWAARRDQDRRRWCSLLDWPPSSLLAARTQLWRLWGGVLLWCAHAENRALALSRSLAKTGRPSHAVAARARATGQPTRCVHAVHRRAGPTTVKSKWKCVCVCVAHITLRDVTTCCDALSLALSALFWRNERLCRIEKPTRRHTARRHEVVVNGVVVILWVGW